MCLLEQYKKPVYFDLLPCITDELSFKKNLCRYLGIKALIEAYARAEKHKKATTFVLAITRVKMTEKLSVWDSLPLDFSAYLAL